MIRTLHHSKSAVFAVVFFSCLGGLLYGFDIGSTSAALHQLQLPISGVYWHDTIHSSAFYRGLVASSSLIGAFISCLFLIVMSSHYSSRHALLGASVCYVFGSLFEMWSYKLGLETLILSRIVYGFGIGMSMVGCPAYLSDMTPVSVRGMAVALKETFIMAGLLSGYSCGYALQNVVGGWAILYVIALPISIVMLIGMITLPDSFRWLLNKNYQNDAIYAICTIYPTISNIQLHEMIHSLNHIEDDEQSRSVCYRLTTAKTFTSLSLAVLLVAFQQFSGQPSILYYLHTLLAELHIDSLNTVWIAAIMLATTLVTPWIIDTLGRKYILALGCIVMLVALLIVGTILLVATPGQYENDAVICVICLLCYVIGYEFGFGPTTWLLTAEISPADSKELILATAMIVNLVCNFVVTGLFPFTVENIGIGNLLFVYAAVTFLCLLFLSTNVIPETKGLTLEDIERLMVQRWAPNTYTYLDIDEA